MSILTNVTSVAVGGIWKVAAIGLLVGMVASDAYLGYQWRGAASERDTAVSERSRAKGARDKALADNGELAAHIFTQNGSIKEWETKTAVAEGRYDTAMQMFAPISRRISDLAARINALKPSTTCEQSLAKQRQAIDGLRSAK